MMNSEKAYFIAKRRALKNMLLKESSFKDFTAYLQSRGIKDENIKRYISQLERHTNWLQTIKNKTSETLYGELAELAEKKDILAYLQYLQEKQNLATQTRAHILGILNHYYNFLHQSGQITTHPTQLIKLRGAKKKILPKILSSKELDELLDTHYELKVRHAKQNKHIRNHLILSLCIYQGLKRSEILSLTFGCIDLKKATVKVKQGHKSNARTLPLEATQIGIFYEYFQTCAEHCRGSLPTLLEERESLLINTSNNQIQEWMKELKKLYPKFTDLLQLRASRITYWIQTEGLRKAQYKAGHRYISSTEEYLANDLESLKEDINRFHPL